MLIELVNKNLKNFIINNNNPNPPFFVILFTIFNYIRAYILYNILIILLYIGNNPVISAVTQNFRLFKEIKRIINKHVKKEMKFT